MSAFGTTAFFHEISIVLPNHILVAKLQKSKQGPVGSTGEIV